MRIPGFTAEQSLYKTGEGYREVGTFDTLASDAKVVPQQCIHGPCVKAVGQLLGHQTWCCFFGGTWHCIPNLPCI